MANEPSVLGMALCTIQEFVIEAINGVKDLTKALHFQHEEIKILRDRVEQLEETKLHGQHQDLDQPVLADN